MHKLLEWIRRDQDDAPPAGEVDQWDVDEELSELRDGYEGVDPSDGDG